MPQKRTGPSVEPHPENEPGHSGPGSVVAANSTKTRPGILRKFQYSALFPCARIRAQLLTQESSYIQSNSDVPSGRSTDSRLGLDQEILSSFFAEEIPPSMRQIESNCLPHSTISANSVGLSSVSRHPRRYDTICSSRSWHRMPQRSAPTRCFTHPLRPRNRRTLGC